ncbi:MAG: hypothetical protein MUF51_03710, partial [Vicinamibacteria bacterium]|jgi:hypothetical protein|nr:hypothetical protein [Vicinamibacteria bacterium]
VSLPAGKQTLAVVSSAIFLRTNVSVVVREGVPQTIEMPGVGRVNIKANPDNCEIFIDGVFVDYPPVLDKAVAAGTHKFSFRWPDGIRDEKVEEIPAGRAVYVMGQKE